MSKTFLKMDYSSNRSQYNIYGKSSSKFQIIRGNTDGFVMVSGQVLEPRHTYCELELSATQNIINHTLTTVEVVSLIVIYLAFVLIHRPEHGEL